MRNYPNWFSPHTKPSKTVEPCPPSKRRVNFREYALLNQYGNISSLRSAISAFPDDAYYDIYYEQNGCSCSNTSEIHFKVHLLEDIPEKEYACLLKQHEKLLERIRQDNALFDERLAQWNELKAHWDKEQEEKAAKRMEKKNAAKEKLS